MDENQNQIAGSQLSKKERRALKRQEKEQTQSQEVVKKKAGKFGKWVFVAILILAICGAIYYFLSKKDESSGEDLSVSYPILERAHVLRPEIVTDYNSNPPTSGKHWSDSNAPVSRGAHDEEFPDEAMVHNLEHGEIWISYQPDISDDVKNELRKIAKDTYKVVLTVRSKNESDIVVAAWGRLDQFNLDNKPLDTKRIEDFISRYRNLGPELIP